MNTKRLIQSGVLAMLFLTLAVSLAFAQATLGTAFTYQGQLKSEGQPYTGACDFQFGLYDDPSGGTSLGDLTLLLVPLTEGYFTVQLDFGADVFTGEPRYLDISVRCPAGTGDYTQLQPRQELTPAPYALYATSAEAAETAIYAASADAVPWTGISGMPAGFADGTDNDTTYAAGSGLTLSDTTFSVNTDTIQARVIGTCDEGYAIKEISNDGTVICEADDNTTYTAGLGLALTPGFILYVDTTTIQARVMYVCGEGFAIRQVNADGTVICEPVGSTVAWSLTGNAGTTPGTNYLGTSDNQALEIKVNNQRVFRFEPNTTSPNLIGGYSGNAITSGVYGATISGGGASGYHNRVTDAYGSVGGGFGNQAGNADTNIANEMFATVAGGLENMANGDGSVIGGGEHNTASGERLATIGGGSGNIASGDWSTIGGGSNNTASGSSSVISGGGANIASGFISTIGGGSDNTASGFLSAIPGGYLNTATGWYSFAAGNRANATTNGSFVWADSQESNYQDHGVNTFNVRAKNGAFIDSATTANPGLNVSNLTDGSTVGEGTAVLGLSTSKFGYGLAGWNNNKGVGVGAWSNSGNLIEAYDGSFPGGTLRFYVDNAGNVRYTGTSAPMVAIPSPTGRASSYVSLYGLSAAEAWYEDLGSSSLVDGKVNVSIDPLFAQTVTLTEDYQVQVTATCNKPVLLYVSEKTATYFTVQGVGLDGKPSNCAFDYRISAKAVGYETVRLEAMDIPEPANSDGEE